MTDAGLFQREPQDPEESAPGHQTELVLAHPLRMLVSTWPTPFEREGRRTDVPPTGELDPETEPSAHSGTRASSWKDRPSNRRLTGAPQH